MLRSCFIVIALAITSLSAGQSLSLRVQIDSLRFVKGNPFSSCSAVTWKIVAHRQEAIQPLIDKLSDQTVTAATDIGRPGYLTIGDLAYLTLDRIFRLPFNQVTGVQVCVLDDRGYVGAVFDYMEKNRTKFRQQVQDYYHFKVFGLRWIEAKPNELSLCERLNLISGHYE